MRDEFARTCVAGADDLVIVNCGNIRPHAPWLDLWSQLWSGGPDLDVTNWQQQLAKRWQRA